MKMVIGQEITEYTIEALDCPFCGCDDSYISSYKDPRDMETYGYKVVCRRCKAEGPIGKTKQSCVELWNERLAEEAEQIQVPSQVYKRILDFIDE